MGHFFYFALNEIVRQCMPSSSEQSTLFPEIGKYSNWPWVISLRKKGPVYFMQLITEDGHFSNYIVGIVCSCELWQIQN